MTRSLILSCMLFTVLFVHSITANALPYRSSFTTHFGAGYFSEEEKSGIPDPETGELPTKDYFSLMVSVGYTSYWPCSKEAMGCLILAPRLQLNMVADMGLKHLASAYLGIGVLKFLGSVRFLIGYGHTGAYGGAPLLGIEFGLLDLLYVNELIDMDRGSSYFSFGIDILGLVKALKMMRESRNSPQRRPPPEYTSPDGRPPSERSAAQLPW